MQLKKLKAKALKESEDFLKDKKLKNLNSHILTTTIFIFYLSLLNAKTVQMGRGIKAFEPDTIAAAEKASFEEFKEVFNLQKALKPGFDINKLEKGEVYNSLFFATSRGQYEMVEFLLKNGFDPNMRTEYDGKTALMASVHYPEITELLIKHGADVNLNKGAGLTALYYAVQYAEPKSVQVLIEHGADIHVKNKSQETLLHTLAKSTVYEPEPVREKYRPQIAELLLKKGLDPSLKDETGKTALHHASDKSNLTEFFLKNGFDPNAKDHFGTTALHLAARKGSLDVLETLLKHGADIQAVNFDGLNALHYSPEPETAKRLVEKGINVNQKTKPGDTILHLLVHGIFLDFSKRFHENRIEILKLVIKQGVNLNEKNNNGDTALHLSSRSEKKLITKILIENGADPNIKNHQGELALKKTSILRETGAHLFNASKKVYLKGKNLFKRVKFFKK